MPVQGHLLHSTQGDSPIRPGKSRQNGAIPTRRQETERLRGAILANESATSSAFSSASMHRASSPLPNSQSSRMERDKTSSPFKVSRPRRPESSHAQTPTSSSQSVAQETEPVLTFWGPDPVPLPSRFARIKRNLIAGHEDEVAASWTRLLKAIREDVDQIEGLGPHLIPSIEFTDLDEPSQAHRFRRDLRRYGVGVVRKVIPRADVDTSVQDTVQYVEAQRRGGPSKLGIGPSVGAGYADSDADLGRVDDNLKGSRHDPACFNLYWTPAQVRARAHPNIRRAQQFMMSLWETRADDQLATQLPITYADRIRIYGTGTTGNEQRHHGVVPPRQATTQSPEDWIHALQSSAGIIAQVDNGSLERWEPDGYQRAGTYDRIFQGRWEEYDPWISACRASANLDLYNGYGACTIFRMFQGVVALSTIEPGMIRLMPSPKLATAYYLLRPFFTPSRPPPEWPSLSRHGRTAEWDAYLAPENWKLNSDPDTIIHGAVPGHAQRITERWHPHLHLRSSMITLPTLQPGDYILWHPDLPYHLSSGDYSHASSVHGFEAPRTPDRALDNVRMLAYVPAAPLTQTNALYLARQRKSYQRGEPGPDFDSSGRSNFVEDPSLRPSEADIEHIGGQAALCAMGLAQWNEDDNSQEKTAGAQARSTSAATSSSSSGAETEVARLANLILFPDKASFP